VQPPPVSPGGPPPAPRSLSEEAPSRARRAVARSRKETIDCASPARRLPAYPGRYVLDVTSRTLPAELDDEFDNVTNPLDEE